MTEKIATVVCSNKPKSFKGAGDDGTHHIAMYGKTLCGRDAGEWFTMEISVMAALESAYCCRRCKKGFST